VLRHLESVGEQALQHLGHLIYRRSIGQFGDYVVFDGFIAKFG
jgi:hypothetical protein